MVLLGRYSRVRMSVKEGANAEDHEEYRESMRLEVHEDDRIVDRRVEWLKDIMFKVAAGNRIESRTVSFVKADDHNGKEKLTSMLPLYSTDRPIQQPVHGTGLTS